MDGPVKAEHLPAVFTFREKYEEAILAYLVTHRS